MDNKKIIFTEQAPKPIGPYSQAVLIGNTIYVSGQIAIIPETGAMALDNIIEETTQVMKNITAVLDAAGMSLAQVVKTSIFLKDMNSFAQVNEVYGSFFSKNFPARETVQVARLPKDVNVEISVVAVKD
ncbi:MAG: RidA family protein [Bacteroidetes bacterium]|nr:RidA family protein [Bacteroidota bacterium]